MILSCTVHTCRRYDHGIYHSSVTMGGNFNDTVKYEGLLVMYAIIDFMPAESLVSQIQTHMVPICST